jgi:hypothetical protein
MANGSLISPIALLFAIGLFRTSISVFITIMPAILRRFQDIHIHTLNE